MLVTPSAGAQHGQAGPFRLCSNRVHSTCVIDGDTFRWQGERIRLLEIDAPETHPSRCAAEAELGQRATLRLQQLLNAGGWTLERGDRDRDQYGRLLRRVAIGKTDAGAILVAEGLARPWDGARHPWC
jgi:endonuclease YncB( thermonuclease family)